MRLPVSQYGNTVSQYGNPKAGRTWGRQAVTGTGAAAAERTAPKDIKAGRNKKEYGAE